MCVRAHMPAQKSFSFPLIILKTHLHRSWIPAVRYVGEKFESFLFEFYVIFSLAFFLSLPFMSLKNPWKAENWKWAEMRLRMIEWNFEFRASMNEFEYRYICCFFSRAKKFRFEFPHHAFIVAWCQRVWSEKWCSTKAL